MSTATLDDATIAYAQRINGYLGLAAIGLLGYDYLLTFRSEVRYIWAPGHSRASAWYLFVRYFALCANMAMLVLYFGNFPSEVCTGLNIAHGILTVLQELLVEVTLILRVLAMYSFDKRVMFPLLLTALIALSVAAWSVVRTGGVSAYKTNLPGCHTPASHSREILLAGCWEGLLVADILLVGLTLYRGYSHCRDMPPGSLWTVLVRDGLMYFVITCLANLANILMYYFGSITTAAGLSTLAVSLSVTMMCRLMLNLHEAASTTADFKSVSGILQFAQEPSTQLDCESEISRTRL
ncbi:hypothetical protein B0H13DRAFT_2043054 [Mycena leptocephala]|nr:hypothetical protein B0H13DRAFT_2043054 [Mycena leptocephala]